MDTSTLLSHFELSKHGDTHEREYWRHLSSRFPTYELLWRQFVVPLTYRVVPAVSIRDRVWIRLRADVKPMDERIAMAHYSVFYFTGRAFHRLREHEEDSLKYPEDIFFLLVSAQENLKRFLKDVNELAKDQDRAFLTNEFNRFPKGVAPFEEIEAYRNAILHNAVLGRASDVTKTFLPRWTPGSDQSALNRAEKSWRKAEQLGSDDLIETRVLFDQLFEQLFLKLEEYWQKALSIFSTGAPASKFAGMIDIAAWNLPAMELLGSTPAPVAPSGMYFPPKK